MTRLSSTLSKPTGLLAAAVAASTLLLSACGSDAAPSAPQTTEVTGEGFTVQMPGTPERTTQQVDLGGGQSTTLVLYSAEVDGVAYNTTTATAAQGVTPDLDGAVRGAAANNGGTVTSQEKVTVDGKEGREAVISGAKSGNETGTVFLTVVSSGQQLVQLIAAKSGQDTQAPAAHTAMRDSLKFTS